MMRAVSARITPLSSSLCLSVSHAHTHAHARAREEGKVGGKLREQQILLCYFHLKFPTTYDTQSKCVINRHFELFSI